MKEVPIILFESSPDMLISDPQYRYQLYVYWVCGARIAHGFVFYLMESGFFFYIILIKAHYYSFSGFFVLFFPYLVVSGGDRDGIKYPFGKRDGEKEAGKVP